MDPAKRVAVLIVDAHPLVRKALRGLLEGRSDIAVAGEASRGSEAVEWVKQRPVDVILMNIRAPEMDGIAATADVVRIRPETKVLALTANDDPQALAQAIRAGAQGALFYEGLEGDHLVRAIRSLASGGSITIPLPVLLALQQYEMPSDPFTSLTSREREILDLLAEGKRNAEIAHALGLKEKTIKNYTRGIYSKLRVRGRDEAVRFTRHDHH